jgi:hypothetical protein
MRRKINTAFDDHDYEQLVLLARLNRLRLTEIPPTFAHDLSMIIRDRTKVLRAARPASCTI